MNFLFYRTKFRFMWISGFICGFYLISGISVQAAVKDKWAQRVQFHDVIEKAKALSTQHFDESPQDLPDILKNMKYDQWRSIRFKPARRLWQSQHFSVQFFHLGFLYQHPVTIHYIDGQGEHQFPFSTDLFDYSNKDLKGYLPQDYGFAGFRVHYPINTPKYADELIAFLGASYFRALGRDELYGMSARGLAINTAEDTGEEFPSFREFWILHPTSRSKSIKIYALLDSNSLTGAYEFTIEPGDETRIKVNSVLFIRQHVQKIGVAALNSMFFYGENSGFKGDTDFRPEVHDSDGLLINDHSGEWIWHPLVNPPKLLVNAFGGGEPRGFGLLQRDIDFDHYQDLEASYERRPSVWVTPKGDWGNGHIELVQLPTDDEYNDNIVAYWVPERAFERGDMVKYAYTLAWYTPRHQKTMKYYVHATRIVKKTDGERMFIVDFVGGEPKDSSNEMVPIPDVWISRGARIADMQLVKNTAQGGWRLVLHVRLDDPQPIEINFSTQKPAIEFRAFLKDKTGPVTETWSYTYLP